MNCSRLIPALASPGAVVFFDLEKQMLASSFVGELNSDVDLLE